MSEGARHDHGYVMVRCLRPFPISQPVFLFTPFLFLSTITTRMTEVNLSILAERYQALRNEENAESEKQDVMKALGQQLGAEGNPAADILTRMGKPDELTPTLNASATMHTMPGPVMPSSATEPPYYFVYSLNKDRSLYFKIDPVKETVISSGWTSAD